MEPTYGSASSTASARSSMKVALVLSAGTRPQCWMPLSSASSLCAPKHRRQCKALGGCNRGTPPASAANLHRALSCTWGRHSCCRRCRNTRLLTAQALRSSTTSYQSSPQPCPGMQNPAVHQPWGTTPTLPHLYSTSISSSVSMCSDTKLTGTASMLRTPCRPSSLHQHLHRHADLSLQYTSSAATAQGYCTYGSREQVHTPQG